jgi:hypothetical protein
LAASRWRRWNNALHRDVGYAIAALTVAYGISGLAVNHIDAWNPSYAVRKEHRRIAPVPDGPREALVADARAKLGLAEAPTGAHEPDAATLELFYGLSTYRVDRPTGEVVVEPTAPRPVLRELNDLHLNNYKGAWTVVADVYAGSLVLVAITGLFVLKGRAGITGRGAWLTALGVLVPLGFVLWYKLRG